MRLLVVFFASVVFTLAAAMAVNWWVDPFGYYWKPRAALAAAHAQPQ